MKTDIEKLDPGELESFCKNFVTPIRISAVLASGYPVICSLWYEYSDDAFYCVTQESAKLIEILRTNPKCAFELSPNEPPYFGVRGQADVELDSVGAAGLLERLILKYLGDTESKLAKSLLARTDTEVMLKIIPRNIFTWDYRSRMSK